MPKVSVLVPVYNVEKYLPQCLDSLLNQTLKDIEIICINDGSTDFSGAILKEYQNKDKRIKVINKPNTGYGDSMNMGIKTATGEYIGILESDDFAQENMFESLYNLAKKYDCEVVKSDWYDYWTDKNESRKSGKIPARKTNKITNAHIDKSLLKILPAIWSAIYKRDFLEKNQIDFLPTPGASYQDTSFKFKVLMTAPKIVLTSNAYVHYRQDNINSSINSKGKVFCICDEYEEIERFMQKNTDLKKEFQEYIYTLQYKAYEYNLRRIDEKFATDFMKKFGEKFKTLYESGVLKKYFFTKIKKTEFLCLINDQNKFYKIYQKKMLKHRINKNRKKIFSIRINPSRVSIVLLGKQIVGVG